MRRRIFHSLGLARPPGAVVAFGLITLGWLGSCSIFPNEVVLPGGGSAGGSDGAGASNEGGSADAGSGAEGGAAGGANMPLAGASAGLGGAMESTGGEAGTATMGGTGGESGAPSAGGAGAGAGGGCHGTRIERVATFTDDTWIEASKPGTTHGDEQRLYVDAANRRALFSMTLPARPADAVLLSAHVTLTLLENADASRSERALELHVLTHLVDENRTSWNNWGNGSSRRWMTPGGDFGPTIADAALPAFTSAGQLTFDVTETLDDLFSDGAVPLSLIALELASPPAPPSELAFGSSEGDASAAPSLVVQYCLP